MTPPPADPLSYHAAHMLVAQIKDKLNKNRTWRGVEQLVQERLIQVRAEAYAQAISDAARVVDCAECMVQIKALLDGKGVPNDR